MKRFFAAAIFFLILSNISLKAQQDPMFTKYMFNSMVFNPAYAGYYDHMYVGAIHRSQWVGIDGAPTTQSLTIHSPLKNNNVGLGFSFVNDVIGPTHTMTGNFVYSYKVPIGKGKLSFGVQGGIMNYRADWSELVIENPDPSYDNTPNRWLPNFGAGIYYFAEKFYVGVASPHLVEYDLRDVGTQTSIYAKQYRHYFGMLGAAIPIRGNDIIFMPSALMKNVGLLSKYRKEPEAADHIGAPTEFDIDLSLLFYQVFRTGIAFRSAFDTKKSSIDSGDIWMSYKMQNGLRIGAAWDFTLTKLKSDAVGSFEIMVGYEFDYLIKRILTPRYF